MPRRKPSSAGVVAVSLASLLAGGATTARAGCATLPRTEAPQLAAALQPQARPMLVHVWASWCRPCVGEWPALAEFLRGYEHRGVDVVALSLDDDTRAAAAVRVLRAARASGCGLRADAEQAVAILRGLDPEWDGALPSTFLLDPRGRLLLAQRGSTDLDALRAALARAAPRGRAKD